MVTLPDMRWLPTKPWGVLGLVLVGRARFWGGLLCGQESQIERWPLMGERKMKVCSIIPRYYAKKSYFLYNTGVSKARLQVWFLSLFSVMKVPDQGTGKEHLFIHSQDPSSNWPLQRGTFF